MIEFKNVSKTYDNGTKALQNINLRIDRGEFVFVVGSSGAGKSTFLKTIMREEVPSSGNIVVNNYDLVSIPKKEIPYYRRTMGIVFQDFRLIPGMTVYDNVAFAMRVIGAREKEISKRVPYVLSLVGLASKAHSLPTEISGGEQQRVALARALVNNANTIIADEPTGNIDPEMSFEIVDLLDHINANGTTVIMVTHEHELVKRFKHRIVVIDGGTIVSDTANGDELTFMKNVGYKPKQKTEKITIMDVNHNVINEIDMKSKEPEPVQKKTMAELEDEKAKEPQSQQQTEKTEEPAKAEETKTEPEDPLTADINEIMRKLLGETGIAPSFKAEAEPEKPAEPAETAESEKPAEPAEPAKPADSDYSKYLEDSTEDLKNE